MSIIDSLMRQARLVEQKIQQRLQGEHVGEEPLEIWRAIARDVEGQIQAVKGGKVFPYRQVLVTVCARSQERQAALGAAFETPRMDEDLRELLRESECEVPEDLFVALRFVAEPGEEWKNPVLNIRYLRPPKRTARPASVTPAPERRTAVLRVVEGKVAQPTYELTRDVTYIGRGADHGNHVAFKDNDDPINRTVSRKHARIVYDPASGEWTLYDQSSARGTTVIRGGRTSRIAPGAHGRKLKPGDQIVIGKAVLEFE